MEGEKMVEKDSLSFWSATIQSKLESMTVKSMTIESVSVKSITVQPMTVESTD